MDNDTLKILASVGLALLIYPAIFAVNACVRAMSAKRDELPSASGKVRIDRTAYKLQIALCWGGRSLPLFTPCCAALAPIAYLAAGDWRASIPLLAQCAIAGYIFFILKP